MPEVIAIIPARMASTRFPGKVLADATGKPLIQHVYESAAQARGLSRTVIATDDQKVMQAAARFGAPCIMTSPDHPNGTSRLHEACTNLNITDPDSIIINVQGDEPEIDPALIEAAADALRRLPHIAVSTIASPFAPGEDPRNPNIVKVVRRLNGTALYFSRALIPFDRDNTNAPESQPLRHVGLYAYRRSFLAKYITLAPTPLEESEKLEQLRILEHGHEIAVAVLTPTRGGSGIDTPEQYAEFVKRWNSRDA